MKKWFLVVQDIWSVKMDQLTIFGGLHYCRTHLIHGTTLKAHRLVTICTQGMQYMRKAPNSRTTSINCIFFARFCVDLVKSKEETCRKYQGLELSVFE